MTPVDLHKLSIEEISQLERSCNDYIETWFALSRRGKELQTKEWVDLARWRLEGQTVPCCECGQDYPKADLHFDGHVYCENCRNLNL